MNLEYVYYDDYGNQFIQPVPLEQYNLLMFCPYCGRLAVPNSYVHQIAVLSQTDHQERVHLECNSCHRKISCLIRLQQR